jgi:hypothetical protein
VSVSLAVVTCVWRQWFGEGQVKGRLIALSTPSINPIPMTAICKIHKTRNNTLFSFVFCSVSKCFIFVSWMSAYKCVHPRDKLHLGLRGTTYQGTYGDVIVKSFMVCLSVCLSVLFTKLFRWSYKEQWDGRGMWHVRESRGFSGQTSVKDISWKT